MKQTAREDFAERVRVTRSSVWAGAANNPWGADALGSTAHPHRPNERRIAP